MEVEAGGFLGLLDSQVTTSVKSRLSELLSPKRRWTMMEEDTRFLPVGPPQR